MSTLVAPCANGCGRLVVRNPPNRRFCAECAKERSRKSKRLYQAKYRTRSKRPYYPRSAEAQREDAYFDVRDGEIVDVRSGAADDGLEES